MAHYKGKLIKEIMKAPVKSVHTATAKRAYNSLMQKYGKVEDEEIYCHSHAGKWVKVGDLGKKSEVKKGDKFSVSKLKASGKMKIRSARETPEGKHKVAVKSMLKAPEKGTKLKPSELQSKKLRAVNSKLITLETKMNESRAKYGKVPIEYEKQHKTLMNSKRKLSASKWIDEPAKVSTPWKVGNIKQVGKPSPRTAKKVPGMKGKAVTKNINRPKPIKTKTKAEQKKDERIKELEAEIKHYEIQAKNDKYGTFQRKVNELKNKLEAVKSGKKYIAPAKQIKPANSRRDMIIQEAHMDWDQQAKNKLMYGRDFRDKSLKDCVNRHLRSAGIQ